MNTKVIYNLESKEDFNQAKIIGGNPNGIANFTKTNHKWAKNLWDLMISYNWFPSEVDLSKDNSNYKNILSVEEKEAYDLCVSQLITNDSIQTNQLVDSINPYITSPIVNACLTRQAYEEANHSKSYAVMVEDICDNTDEIYNLHNFNEQLKRKNNSVGDMYKKINNSSNNEINKDDLIMAFVANQILEELVFPGGFITIWSLGKKMPGSAEMISFIERDESGTHVPLFKNIFRTAINENYNGIVPNYLLTKIYKLIEHMTNEEIIWTKYLTRNLLGFSEEAIELFIKGQANSICNNLKIDLLYPNIKISPLMRLYDEYSKLKRKGKTNFFEKKVGDYSIGSLDMNY